MLTPFIGAAVVGSGAASPEQTAVITALSMLASGGIASALGRDSLAAAYAAQNETLNNCSMHECWNGIKEKLTSFGSAVAAWVATPEGQLTSAMVAIAGDMGGGLGGTGGAVRNAAADSIENSATRIAARSGVDDVRATVDVREILRLHLQTWCRSW